MATFDAPPYLHYKNFFKLNGGFMCQNHDTIIRHASVADSGLF